MDLVFYDTTLPRPAVTKPGIPSSYSSYTYQPKVDQNIVRLSENSALAIDKLTAMQTGADTVTDTELDLKTGRLYFRVKKMSKASRYEIKIPNGVAGIRGSEGVVDAGGLLQMISGSAVFAFGDSAGNIQTQNVGPDQQVDISPNGQFSPPGTPPGSVAPMSQDNIQSVGQTFSQMPSGPTGGPGGAPPGGGQSTVVSGDQTVTPLSGTTP